jgi:hypothetical protein
MKFVIAGTRAEAEEWIRKDIEKRSILREVISMKDYIILDDVHRLRGMKDPHGVFVGTYKSRPDYLDIIRELMMVSTFINPVLTQMWKEVRPRPKLKQPPLQKVAGGYTVAVNDAARLMGEAIDAEVIRQFNGGDMTNRYNEVRKAMDSL